MPTGKYKRKKEHIEKSIKIILEARKNNKRCINCGRFYNPKKEHICKKIPITWGNKISEGLRKSFKEGRRKPINYWLNKKRDDKTKQKISRKKKLLYNLGLHKLNPNIKKGFTLNTGRTHFRLGSSKGSKNHNWKGGISLTRKKVYDSLEYRKWRKAVFQRDKYVCQDYNCKGQDKIIHAHHIKSINKNPNLIFDLNNGLTLCRKCHIKYHKEYGW